MHRRYFDAYSELIEKWSVRYDDVMVIDDFNENMIMSPDRRCCRSNCSSCRLRKSMSDHDLNNIGRLPTHFTEDRNPTQTYLIYTNYPEKMF